MYLPKDFWPSQGIAGAAGILHGKMPTMFARNITFDNYSFFLFGPRGVGKTTLLRQLFSDALWFNLLRESELLALLQDPNKFRRQVEARPRNSWVVVDEVQKLPSLLDEAHDLMNTYGKDYKFVFSGSNARKLKRSGVNLLAGRALTRNLFPLTSTELGQKFNLEQALNYGLLPAVWNEPDLAGEILSAYVLTYIKEEIQQEAVVRNLPAFTRFLKVAALMNGSQINFSDVARETGTARSTVQGYFQILIDTLLATLLDAWRPRAKLREQTHPKFYLFDCGVTRALAGCLHRPAEAAERGPLLETLILHELRALLHYQKTAGALYFWRSANGAEIDFVWRLDDYAVGIEVKNTTRLRRDDTKYLNEALSKGVIKKGFIVFQGEREEIYGNLHAVPLEIFLGKLWSGGVLNTKN
mgnify:CR=1 FL=1